MPRLKGRKGEEAFGGKESDALLQHDESWTVAFDLAVEVVAQNSGFSFLDDLRGVGENFLDLFISYHVNGKMRE